jgi:hypothetical protein
VKVSEYHLLGFRLDDEQLITNSLLKRFLVSLQRHLHRREPLALMHEARLLIC